jgi:DnaJ-class molecular chaperone
MKPPVCETCDGEGRGMGMVCYGGPPIEVMVDCPDCDGTGKADYEFIRLYLLEVCATLKVW